MIRLNEKATLLSFAALLAISVPYPSFAEDGPAPGPALEARQKLFERIQQARQQGIGIGGYMAAFKALEDQVKAGDPAEKIGSRVESIHSAINKQLDNAKILKTQKPLPPQGSQVTGSDPIAQPGPGPGSKGGGGGLPPGLAGGGGGGDILSKLKGKFGDKLDNLPDSVKDRLMNDPNLADKIKQRAGGGDGGAPPPPQGGGRGGQGGAGGAGGQGGGPGQPGQPGADGQPPGGNFPQ